MKLTEAIKIVKYHQSWRQGKQEEMKYSPQELTEAIDILLGNTTNSDLLLNFLLYLYNKGLIDNHSFNYEKVIRSFLKYLKIRN